MARIKTCEEVRQCFIDNGCQLLTSKEEYKNTQAKLSYICKCGEKSTTNYTRFKIGQRCKKCGIKNKSKQSGIKLSYDYVYNFFKEKGCLLLETEYITAKTRMNYICSCGERAVIVWDSFRVGTRCRKCGTAKSAEKQRYKDSDKKIKRRSYLSKEPSNRQRIRKFSHRINTKEGRKKYIEENGSCIILDESYVSSVNSSLKLQCHCGRIFTRKWNQMTKCKKIQCYECSVKGRSGENHYEWISNRETKNNNDFFRQKCYKLLKRVLKVIGQNKEKRAQEMLGYTSEQLEDHIKSHPNWERVSREKWAIDHIFPIKAFLDYGISDIKLINCLDNLQPLTAVENGLKGDFYDREVFEKWLKSNNREFYKS